MTVTGETRAGAVTGLTGAGEELNTRTELTRGESREVTLDGDSAVSGCSYRCLPLPVILLLLLLDACMRR